MNEVVVYVVHSRLTLYIYPTATDQCWSNNLSYASFSFSGLSAIIMDAQICFPLLNAAA